MLRFVTTKQFSKFLVRDRGLRFISYLNSLPEIPISYPYSLEDILLRDTNTRLNRIEAKLERLGVQMEDLERKIDQALRNSLRRSKTDTDMTDFALGGVVTLMTVVILICGSTVIRICLK